MAWEDSDARYSSDESQTTLMAGSLHVPSNKAPKDDCELIKAKWFMDEFEYAINRCTVLWWCTNWRNKVTQYRFGTNYVKQEKLATSFTEIV